MTTRLPSVITLLHDLSIDDAVKLLDLDVEGLQIFLLVHSNNTLYLYKNSISERSFTVNILSHQTCGLPGAIFPHDIFKA